MKWQQICFNRLVLGYNGINLNDKGRGGLVFWYLRSPDITPPEIYIWKNISTPLRFIGQKASPIVMRIFIITFP